MFVYKPVPRFKQWLAGKSTRLADFWRFRKRITPDMKLWSYEFPLRCSLEKPFAAFQEMVRRRFADIHMDTSRLNAMTALYLRCAGFKRKTVDQGMGLEYTLKFS